MEEQEDSDDEIRELKAGIYINKSSVADPFIFGTDPDPRISFVKKRTRPKIEKCQLFYDFFSSDYQKNYLLLYKKFLLDLFNLFAVKKIIKSL